MGSGSYPSRHVGVARQLLDLRVRKGPYHDAVDVARKHPRGVGDRLSAPELHVARREKERVSAELPGADFEGDARARRGLHEDHRQRFSGERLFLVLARAHQFGERKQLVELLGGVIRDLKEIAVGSFFLGVSGHVSCAERAWIVGLSVRRKYTMAGHLLFQWMLDDLTRDSCAVRGRSKVRDRSLSLRFHRSGRWWISAAARHWTQAGSFHHRRTGEPCFPDAAAQR